MRVVLHGHPDTIPPGLWCYRVDAARTLLGGALNDVGRVVTWLEDTLRLDRDGLAVDREAALLAPPDDGAPVVLPYLTGERSTGWAGGARALFADVTAATTPTLLYRGALEGVALTYARVAEQLQQAAGRAHRIAASGRVTADHPGWLQVLADALGAPVEHVTMKRTTLHGTALIALEVLAPDEPRAPVETGRTYEPVAGRAAYYADRRARYQAAVRGGRGADGVSPAACPPDRGSEVVPPVLELLLLPVVAVAGVEERVLLGGVAPVTARAVRRVLSGSRRGGGGRRGRRGRGRGGERAARAAQHRDAQAGGSETADDPAVHGTLTFRIGLEPHRETSG